MMDLVGLTEACPRGAAFVGWLVRRSPDHYQLHLDVSQDSKSIRC
jgi:hypothetical protein